MSEKVISGTWELRFPYGWGIPLRINELKSWTEFKDEGIKYFSGIATYKKNF